MAWNKKIRMIVFSVIISLVGLGELFVCLQTILRLSSAAFGIAATIVAAGSATYGNREKTLTPLIITFYAMAMGTNCITSSLIVSRICNVKRESARYRSFILQQQDPLSRAIRITVEAGLIYSISLIVLLIIYLTHHNSQFGVQRIVGIPLVLLTSFTR